MKPRHGGLHDDGRPVLRSHRRALATLRIQLAALVLWKQGHKRASRMMRGWTAPDPSPEAIAKARDNLVRRYPG